MPNFECSGTWMKSKLIFPTDTEKDGDITLNAEDGQGNFTGTHHKTNKPVKGVCSAIKHIKFSRIQIRGKFTYTYTYEGDVAPAASGSKIANGTIKRVQTLLKKKIKNDDGDWVAERPPTLKRR
jgi:hypothetical protein